jgi:hypothetical protein
MLDFFRKKNTSITERPRISGPNIYDYRILEATDLGDYSNAIDDIYHRKYDGILVKNAMPENVCDEIIAAMKKLPRSLGTEMPIGWAFPVIFAHLANEAFRAGEEKGKQKMSAYFADCAKIFQNSRDYFSVDVRRWIEEWLDRFSGGVPVKIPEGYAGQGNYAATTYRSYLNRGVGHISVHCGNWFQTVWKDFYAHLETQVMVYDQLSYFFCLQQADQGGELALYDFEWENGQRKSSNHENRTVLMADDSSLDIEKRQKMLINPAKGDLILFAGGQIWHRVEAVRGKTERVTLAGFLSFAKDKKNKCVYYWT